MKLVINSCYGGFSFSPAAIRRLAELQGRPCFFFQMSGSLGHYEPIDENDPKAARSLLVTAFDIPNPNEVVTRGDWRRMSQDERRAQNALFEKHNISERHLERNDPRLIQIVEELGSEKASGSCAKLSIVEIPDDIQWEISEYDGIESVEEAHRSWS